MKTKAFCYCESHKIFDDCCYPFLSGQSYAPTAERLMRSRYSAYVVKNVDYLIYTCRCMNGVAIDKTYFQESLKEITWVGLKIISVKKGERSDKQGFVCFEASYIENGIKKTMRENSMFKKDAKSGHWFYIYK